MTGQTARSRAYHRNRDWEARQAEHRAAVRAAKEEWTYYVYRCYDKDDRLLYIGCTQDIGGRMAVHAASWGNPASAYLNLHMARYEVQEVVGFTAARKAEREAIAAEAPLLNVHHNKGRGLPRVPVEPPTREEIEEAGRRISAYFGDILGGPFSTA
jgi:predicted GIY-YIG superfamily endonuclease